MSITWSSRTNPSAEFRSRCALARGSTRSSSSAAADSVEAVAGHDTTVEAVRSRAALYVGSTDADGLDRLLSNLVDPVINQFLKQRATELRVDITGGP